MIDQLSSDLYQTVTNLISAHPISFDKLMLFWVIVLFFFLARGVLR